MPWTIVLPDLLAAVVVCGDVKIWADPPEMRCVWHDWR